MIFVICLLFLVVNSSNAQNIDWKKDLDFLEVELPKHHKDFFARRDKEYFSKGVQKIRKEIENGEFSNVEIINN